MIALAHPFWEFAAVVPADPLGRRALGREIVHRQIILRGVGGIVNRRPAPPDQVLRRLVGRADCHVGFAPGQIKDVVGDGQTEFYIRIKRAEAGEIRHQ